MKEVNNLSAKYKEVIVLYYLEEFSLKEVSEILSIPLGTCKSRLYYAIKKLNRNCKVNLSLLGGRSYES